MRRAPNAQIDEVAAIEPHGLQLEALGLEIARHRAAFSTPRTVS